MSVRLEPRVRLRARAEFTSVQQRGRRVSTTHMTVLALPNALDHDRLGVIASRKLGGAVLRNRAKRRVRALFRELEPDTIKTRGHHSLDLVIIPRRELVAAPYADLQMQLSSALARLDRTRPR